MNRRKILNRNFVNQRNFKFRRGLVLVLSSPSGAGKSTISKGLIQRNSDVSLSVSVTTRARRPNEIDGVDYIFKTITEFQLMIDREEFLEHATVFGHHYGTPKHPIDMLLDDGKDVIFDVDWQGSQQLRQNLSEDLVSIFILPPSIGELEKRLSTRAQDSEDVVKKRMDKASSEMSHWPEYDYIIINENISESIDQAESILIAERLHRKRQTGLHEFVKGLV